MMPVLFALRYIFLALLVGLVGILVYRGSRDA
jgi:hypothetical protein